VIGWWRLVRAAVGGGGQPGWYQAVEVARALG
jgi:hypothetical protein